MASHQVGDECSPIQRGRLRTVLPHDRDEAIDNRREPLDLTDLDRSLEGGSISSGEQFSSIPKAISSIDAGVQPESVNTPTSQSHARYSIVRSPKPPHGLQRTSSMSNRRGIDLNLPRFDNFVVGRPTRQLVPSPATTMSNKGFERDVKEPKSPASRRFHYARQQILRSHSLGPLTPPHDIEIPCWSSKGMNELETEAQQDSSGSMSANGASTSTRDLSLSQQNLPKVQPEVQMSFQGLSQVPWLDRALQKISKYIFKETWAGFLTSPQARSSDTQSHPQYIEFASQVLPNHALDRRRVKTSELICDYLQQSHTDLQGITITHAIAVPQSQTVEDFPKSPPTTPNFVVKNGYFDEPIIVTKAANVPMYHGISGRVQETGVQIQRRIMVRSVVDIALLERCIPPTTASEIDDLFNADSYRSYLADRLSELAVGAGSLLLIYPTLTGGRTFTRNYIGPIIDPLLREMSILRGLDSNAAQRLGAMGAVDSMMDFNQMKTKVELLCSNMSQRSRALSVRSSYTLVHSESTELVLDRNTWMTWFVEQEQQRLKQNLVDYHKDGGRMPQGDGGSSEVTAGMLTREIIEALQKSKQQAGGVGIEVGVFVIRRSRRND